MSKLVIVCLTIIAFCGILNQVEAEWIPVNSGGGGDGGGGAAGPAPLGLSSQQTSNTVEVSMTLPGYDKGTKAADDGITYNPLEIPGCGTTAAGAGAPELPCKRFFLDIPYGVSVSVQVASQDLLSKGTGYIVWPLQPDYPMNEDPPPFTKDAAAYATGAFWPATPVSLGAPAIIRGRRVVPVEVCPLQYNPVTGEIKAFASLAFAVVYHGQIDPNGEARKRRYATPEFENLARSTILNAQATSPFQEDATLLKSDAGGGLPTDTNVREGYLIIVGDESGNPSAPTLEQVTPFAEWKRQKGYIVTLVSMSEIKTLISSILTPPTWDNIASFQLKTFLVLAYEQWNPPPSYVLLIGDEQHIPPVPVCEGLLEPCLLKTDHYYPCVDGRDNLPDIMVGRITASGATCEDVLGKMIAYDDQPPITPGYDKFIVVSDGRCNAQNQIETWYSFLFESSQFASALSPFMIQRTLWGIVGCTFGLPCPDGYFSSYTWQQNGSSVPCSIYRQWFSRDPNNDLMVTKLPDEINAGTSLLIYQGHGSRGGWWGAIPHLYMFFGSGDVARLTNTCHPLVFSLACLTADWYSSSNPSLCESFVNSLPGGAIGAFGSSTGTGMPFMQSLTYSFLDAFLPDFQPGGPPTPVTSVGAAYLYSKLQLLNSVNPNQFFRSGQAHAGYERQACKLNWFGDPELGWRSSSPHEVNVTHAGLQLSSLAGCYKELGVTATNTAGEAVTGARVALSRRKYSGESWQSLQSSLPNCAVTDTSGRATLYLDAATWTERGNRSDAAFDLVVTHCQYVSHHSSVLATPDLAFSIPSDCADHMTISSDGQVTVRGNIYTLRVPSLSDYAPAMIIRDQPGDMPLMVLSPQGDLWLAGLLFELPGGVSPPTMPTRLEARDSQVTLQCFLDESGSLYTRKGVALGLPYFADDFNMGSISDAWTQNPLLSWSTEEQHDLRNHHIAPTQSVGPIPVSLSVHNSQADFVLRYRYHCVPGTASPQQLRTYVHWASPTDYISLDITPSDIALRALRGGAASAVSREDGQGAIAPVPIETYERFDGPAPDGPVEDEATLTAMTLNEGSQLCAALSTWCELPEYCDCNWATCDFDNNGIPDQWEALLVLTVLYNRANPFWADAREYYEDCMEWLENRPYFPLYEPYKHILVVFRMTDPNVGVAKLHDCCGQTVRSIWSHLFGCNCPELGYPTDCNCNPWRSCPGGNMFASPLIGDNPFRVYRDLDLDGRNNLEEYQDNAGDIDAFADAATSAIPGVDTDPLKWLNERQWEGVAEWYTIEVVYHANRIQVWRWNERTEDKPESPVLDATWLDSVGTSELRFECAAEALFWLDDVALSTLGDIP